jgi:hypothetical protein
MRKQTGLTLILFLIMAAAASAQSTAFPPSILTSHPGPSDFQLFVPGQAAAILVDPNDSKTVVLCAGLFADDVERVTGTRPAIIHDIRAAKGSCIVIGSAGSSRIIKTLAGEKKIDLSAIKGKWESSLTRVVDNPLPGIDRALVIAGSDRRGTAYGIFELSKQIGVSPWYYFADMPVKKKDRIFVKSGRYILKSPSVKYRGIFINDEMWGLRPWAMYTHAPAEGKGIGPTTYRDIFELLLRLKANTVWPAMHQWTKPFNEYPENKVVADEYGIVMGSSHIEPMLRNNIGGAEWDTEYPGEPWDYVKNRDHIYQYWENRVKSNGRYENIYTLGKRGKDDEAGSDITVPVLEKIFADQRGILKKWVNRDVTKVPQVLIPYTEVLGLYNKGLKVPEDVIICWPDDNFGNIRQLPNTEEQRRSGGSGIYYHFQWLNGATTAYTWTCTTPIGLTWCEMRKAYDYGADKLWIVNVGDIKPAEMNIEYFMQLAWDINAWGPGSSTEYIRQWAEREFGTEPAGEISGIMQKHYELGYARRPESMVLWNGREQKLSWEWFTDVNYGDEAQRRIDDYANLIRRVDRVYESLPQESKDAFFETVVYNVKGTALQNIKVLNAQKSHDYGTQKRASAAVYAARAQEAENGIHALIDHYNRGLLTVGGKWDHMASLPGPWGGQWHQWDMPPLSEYSGEGEPELQFATEGSDSTQLPVFSGYNRDKHYIDLFNTGTGAVYWKLEVSDAWIRPAESSGVVYDEKRIGIDIDWSKAPEGKAVKGSIRILRLTDRGMLDHPYDTVGVVALELFHPAFPGRDGVKGFVEGNGYIAMEAEHFTRKSDAETCGWQIIDGLGRTGNSVTVLPPTVAPVTGTEEILRRSPRLEYDLYNFTPGEAKLQLNCSPGYPINSGYGQRIAIALDDGKPQIIEPAKGSRNVMDNLMIIKGLLNFPAAGTHTLKVWMVDPGIVVDKIIIDTGGVKDSYLGPPESFCGK